MRERFFDGITYGFRRFINKSTKQKDYSDDWEDRPLPSEQVNKTFLRAITFQGVVLLLIMIALLVFYYM
ncbi:hypothetical protein GCM10011351_08270 [Paraliobacillus quinghaiensis]|uniref:DUF3899 domain-containing protein n=2 Tax=Paraliobacillus quinghaiensis TaxID=470815 RepID=A0A917TJP5_9BACI|nr:hypothetical protein GCM10011351_08270 [Paraliobacillus quinghaiensis]